MTQKLTVLTQSILNDTLVEVISDKTAPKLIAESACKIYSDKNSLSILLTKYTFLNSCLAKKKIISSAKEESWAKFHEGILKNSNNITESTNCTALTSWLGLKLFGKMIFLTYEFHGEIYPASDVILLPEEEEIVEYIGGSAIQKLRKVAFKLSNRVTKSLQLELLGLMYVITPENEEKKKSLISCKSLGGLLTPVESLKFFFLNLEQIFRKLFGVGTQTPIVADVHEYLNQCLSEELKLKYLDVVKPARCTSVMKENTMQAIIKLYFKIRIFHKYKLAMDRIRVKTKTEKRQKSLRKRLLKENIAPGH